MRTMRLLSGLILLTLVIFGVSCGSSDGRVANLIIPPTFGFTSKVVSLTGGATTADVTLEVGNAKVIIPAGTQIIPTTVGPIIGKEVTLELADGSGNNNAQTAPPTGFNKAGRFVIVVKSDGTIIPASFTKPVAVQIPVAAGVTTGILYALFDANNARVTSSYTWKPESNSVSISNGIASTAVTYSGIYSILTHQQGGS